MELGQMMHGNPPGDYNTPEWIDALVAYILDEMERIVWNNQQTDWDRYYDPELPGVQFRPYYWGEDEKEAALPNLKFDFSEQDIRWYKHPGRSMSFSVQFTNEEWLLWFGSALKVVRAAELDKFK